EKISGEIYAVYFDYEKDFSGSFFYFIGCKVEQDSAIPEGLDELNVPDQNYTRITSKGVMTGCITDAWQEIWKSDLQRNYGFDFELYDERSRDWNNAEVDIFISTIEETDT